MKMIRRREDMNAADGTQGKPLVHLAAEHGLSLFVLPCLSFVPWAARVSFLSRAGCCTGRPACSGAFPSCIVLIPIINQRCLVGTQAERETGSSRHSGKIGWCCLASFRQSVQSGLLHAGVIFLLLYAGFTSLSLCYHLYQFFCTF